eukprot:scaffold2063_cov401-Prasinococcus_capsulatus_cf.AAC.23
MWAGRGLVARHSLIHLPSGRSGQRVVASADRRVLHRSPGTRISARSLRSNTSRKVRSGTPHAARWPSSTRRRTMAAANSTLAVPDLTLPGLEFRPKLVGPIG